MLRVSDSQPEGDKPESYLTIDKKKKQVTLSEPTTNAPAPSSSVQDRAPMVSAPKMFAFDALHTKDDSQVAKRQQANVLSYIVNEHHPF